MNFSGMLHRRLILKLTQALPLLFLLAACGNHVATMSGNAEGFGGGDPLLGPVEAARANLIVALVQIKKGYNLGGIGGGGGCPADFSQVLCKTLRELTVPQRQEVRAFLQDMASSILDLNTKLPIVAFSLETAPILVTGPDGNSLEVMARTELGASGPIEIRDSAVRNKSMSMILALISHEFAHKVRAPNGTPITDNDPVGAFNFPGGGRAKLDAVGASLALYYLFYNQPSAMAWAYAPSLWTGPTGNPGSQNKMLVWGGMTHLEHLTNSGFLFDPLTDGFVPMSATSAPTQRYRHAALWTGSTGNASTNNRLIVWGGMDDGHPLNSGALYHPDTDTWKPISLTGAPDARAGSYNVNNNPGNSSLGVWTGKELIVWGGWAQSSANLPIVLGTGGIYNPETETWRAMSAVNAPSPRADASIVWTGTKMIVWGGTDGTSLLDTGAAYDPVTNQWTAISHTAAPYARKNAATVWTGTQMLVWGDDTNDSPTADGGARYNPATDTWTAVSNSGAPLHHGGASVVWTGKAMLIFGGQNGGIPANDGGMYDLASNTWTAIARPVFNDKPFSTRTATCAVWTGATQAPKTGNRMILWGGVDLTATPRAQYRNTGATYKPMNQDWNLIR